MDKSVTRPKVLTVSETAQRLSIRMESIYRLIYAGLLEGQRVDGKWELSQKSVENYAAKHSRKGRVSASLTCSEMLQTILA
jgi:predicted site-specific integrase-resolvase